MRVLKQVLQGKDGQWSLRRILAALAFLGIMDCTHYGIRHGIAVDVVGLVGVLAGLVAALLSLTTYQNTKNDATNKEL
jgi:hypothetical protein